MLRMPARTRPTSNKESSFLRHSAFVATLLGDDLKEAKKRGKLVLALRVHVNDFLWCMSRRLKNRIYDRSLALSLSLRSLIGRECVAEVQL